MPLDMHAESSTVFGMSMPFVLVRASMSMCMSVCVCVQVCATVCVFIWLYSIACDCTCV